MPTGDLAGDPLRVAAFIGDAKKADLVGFLAQCGELHAAVLISTGYQTKPWCDAEVMSLARMSARTYVTHYLRNLSLIHI